MGMKTNNVSNSSAITSNEDARRTLSLVKEVAVDGEEGAAHDAASGGGHFRHLWMANMNALATICPTGSNLVGRGKTSPANVWIMASFPEPNTLNTCLSAELLKKNKNRKISVTITGVTQGSKAAMKHISTAQQKLLKTNPVMLTFRNQHQECNSGFDVLFEYKAEWKKESASGVAMSKRQI